MATTKNLCAQIPIDLHERVSEERERLGQTTSEYIANLIQDYYNMMENQKGGIQMTEKGTIGIIGPKRMDYEKVVGTMHTMMSRMEELYGKNRKDS